jgi:aminomethyltransferase
MTSRDLQEELVAETAPEGLLRETPLKACHEESRAHLVPFHGWRMPLYYEPTGILAEHAAVRRGAGMFDVSHMGILVLSGEGSAQLLSRRTPARIDRLEPGQCRYTVFLRSDGTILDDAIISRLPGPTDRETFLVVPNAGMTPRLLEVLLQHRPRHVRIDRLNGSVAILAVQGPRSPEILSGVTGWDLSGLRSYRGALFPFTAGAIPGPGGSADPTGPDLFRDRAWVSRTGYTGEMGFEVFLEGTRAEFLWRSLQRAGVVPCGLGARDTLRMEMGYLLSGEDFHGDRTPLEAGLERFLEFDHPFVGREALEKQRAQGGYPRFVGLRMEGPGAIPRRGAGIWRDGTMVSRVTSGGQSPTLGVGIALAYLPPDLAVPGTRLEIEVRDRRAPAEVVPRPFVHPSSM